MARITLDNHILDLEVLPVPGGFGDL